VDTSEKYYKNEKMNILIFGSRIIYGGGEKMLNWLAKRLIQNGDNVIFATPNNNDEYRDKLEKVGLLGQVKIVEYPQYNKYKQLIRYYNGWKRIFKDNNIDILLIFGGSIVEQRAAHAENVKVVLSERWYPKARSFASQILKQIQYKYADGYVFQTVEASKCYNKRAQRLSVIIPNPIIDNLPEAKTIERKEVVTVGRLAPEKNQGLVIKAFAIFSKNNPDHYLKIYGSGPLKTELLNLMESLQLSGKVEIIEGKRNISELINGADLFVLPSNVEGMPNALIEAMAMGITSISTDCPAYGSRMLIQDGENGYLVPLDDVEKLAEAMNRAVRESDRERIKNNSLKIRERLDADKTADKWICYFKKILGITE